jgi:hypothetical protein
MEKSNGHAAPSVRANDFDVDDLVNLAEEISYKKCEYIVR